ncbi:Uma2 family endonuclease [Fibrella sp. HMF5335]|uniref:Uma2 family endonuclease n=1 Tax=Fibrella rubiginis TaxID=2817060 RepID=A0A939GMD6_9BACT|nr:Uma2 family endonuclease [Fibrella rubiginis]MBO0940034.1 Uma2 family endonuclease [Fibrella rubiginis]
MEAVIEEISDYERERGKPAPSLNHTYVQSNLLFELHMKYRGSYSILPELDLLMADGSIMIPDIAIYHKLPVDFLHDIQSMTTMPLTAVEIISPSHRNADQSNDDILAKFERYFAAGVKSCWLVIPSFKAISVYSAPGTYQFFMHDSTLSDPATGIELPLAEVFE